MKTLIYLQGATSGKPEIVESFKNAVESVGGGTFTIEDLKEQFEKHDTVIISVKEKSITDGIKALAIAKALNVKLITGFINNFQK